MDATHISFSVMEEYLVIGLMMGTSGDGVDAALERVRIQAGDVDVEFIEGITEPIPDQIRLPLFAMFESRHADLEQLTLLDTRIGQLLADTANALLQRAGFRSDQVTVIGSHGQTVFHVAEFREIAQRQVRGSLQVGDGAAIADSTGIPTVTNFRSADIAAGGCGAPLVPLFDTLLARHLSERSAFQNIGGIANVTWIEPESESLIAFDTGPGNMIIDALASRASGGALPFDRDGSIGRAGHIRQDILNAWLDHPYFAEKPPKSTGRELFGTAFLDDFLQTSAAAEDLVRTAEAFTAHSIARAYRQHLPRMPERVVVTGGGTRNPVIMEELSTLLPECIVCRGEDIGLNSDLKEAMAFGVLGLFHLLGRHGNVPAATGADHPAILGKLCLPPNGRSIPRNLTG
jgi:anhydro-N-acetylmuramic acid kinase